MPTRRTPPFGAPGIYPEEEGFSPPAGLPTGIPAFLGYAQRGPVNEPTPLGWWPEFEAVFGEPAADGYLAHAVRGFFENGGRQCYTVRLKDAATELAALRAGLAALEPVDAADLLCAPDIVRPRAADGPPSAGLVAELQAEVLADCLRAGRFAILDTTLTGDPVPAQGHRSGPGSENGALYYPWVRASPTVYGPPCGHVAGVYARCDRVTGVHKAPANEAIRGVVDLRAKLTDEAVDRLWADRVNCLRAMPGRGIRVWGARTLSDDPAWRSVTARRVFLTLGRWLERFLSQATYEPNDVRLWIRITRELTACLDGMFQRGALRGRTAEEAFFVRCDGETNPPEVTAAGMVVTNVGLALAVPAEYIAVRIVQGPGGVSVQPASATYKEVRS